MSWKMRSTRSWIPKLRPDLEPKIVALARSGTKMLADADASR